MFQNGPIKNIIRKSPITYLKELSTMYSYCCWYKVLVIKKKHTIQVDLVDQKLTFGQVYKCSFTTLSRYFTNVG